MKGFEVEERLVYQIIEDSGNKGIWIRDIRIKSNLGQTHIAKIVKTLESKKLIKSVKSVQASKKKVYMLYDVTPDESLTGGAWYSDQEFESEFVEVLNQHCYKFLQRKVSIFFFFFLINLFLLFNEMGNSLWHCPIVEGE